MDGKGLSLKIVLTILPIVFAGIISSKSLSDNRNFLEDVVLGALLGTIIGIIFYSIYFPSIFDVENSGKAYPPRRFGIPFFYGKKASQYQFDGDIPCINQPNFNADTTRVILPQEETMMQNMQPINIIQNHNGYDHHSCLPSKPQPPVIVEVPVFQPPPPAPNITINLRKHRSHNNEMELIDMDSETGGTSDGSPYSNESQESATFYRTV